MCYNNIVRSGPRLAFVPPGAFLLSRVLAAVANAAVRWRGPCLVQWQGALLDEGENQWLTGTAYAPWRRGQDSNLRQLGTNETPALPLSYRAVLSPQRRIGVPADPPQERIMPRKTPVAVGFRPPRPRLSGVLHTVGTPLRGVRYHLRKGRCPIPSPHRTPEDGCPYGMPGTTPSFTFLAGITLPAGGD